MWCLSIFTGRMPRSGKLPVLNLLTGQKSGFLPRRGDLLHRFTSNLARPTGTWLRLAMQNFTSIATGVEMWPNNITNFYFLVKSRPCGRLPWPISKMLRGFYTPNNRASVIQIWRDSLHKLRSYCWETARWSIRPNFSVHPVGKTIRWIEKWMAPRWPRRALSPCKVWGRSYNMRRL